MHLVCLLTTVPVFLSFFGPKKANGQLPEGLGMALCIDFKHQLAEVTADTCVCCHLNTMCGKVEISEWESNRLHRERLKHEDYASACTCNHSPFQRRGLKPAWGLESSPQADTSNI